MIKMQILIHLQRNLRNQLGIKVHLVKTDKYKKKKNLPLQVFI